MPARSEPRCLRASQYTGSAPSAIATACATSSRSGLGHSHQSGAKSISTGSMCAPSLNACSPVSVVTRRGWPCAVDQTACTMFPRSKRPVSNERWRSIDSAPNPAAKAAAAVQTARGAVR